MTESAVCKDIQGKTESTSAQQKPYEVMANSQKADRMEPREIKRQAMGREK